MARRGAARREKRIAKRESAKESRGGQKYKNQKGGITKPERMRGSRGKKGKGKGGRDSSGEENDEVSAPTVQPRARV